MFSQHLLANWESTGLYWLFVWALAGTAVWGGAAGLVACLRYHSAQARHRVWVFSMIAVLIAPLLAPFVPVSRSWEWSSEENTEAVDAKVPLYIITAATNNERSRPTTPKNERIAVTEDHGLVDSLPVSASQSTEAPFLINEPTTRPIAWRLAMVAIWLSGAALSLFMFVMGLWQTQRLCRRAVQLTEGVETRLGGELCKQLGIRRNARLLATPEVSVAFLTGAFNPVIVLPAGYGRWSSERLRVVLTHELIHLKRKDVLCEIISQLATVPVWFHPLGWLAVRRLRIERELACDDAVLLRGERPTDYAEQLVEVAAELHGRGWRAAPIVAMAGASPIERRVRSILDSSVWRAPLGRWRTIGLTLGMAGLVLAVAALSPSIGEDKAATPSVTTDALSNAQAEATLPEFEDANQRLVKELEKTVKLQLDNVLFENALLMLAKRLGAPICIHERSFIDASEVLSPNITLKISGVKLRDAIKSLVEAATGGVKIDIVLESKHGTLHIFAAKTTDDELNHRHQPGGDRITVTRGTVHTVEGKPAEGCEIVARTHTKTTVLSTDKNGTFAIVTRAVERDGLALQMRSDDGQQLATHTLPHDISNDQDLDPLDLTLQKTKNFTVAVANAEGKPIAQAHTAITGPNGAFDRAMFHGYTDSAGRFTAKLPEKLQIGCIFAIKPGAGLDYRCYIKSPRNHDLQAPSPEQPTDLVKLTLSGTRPVSIKYVDEDAQPIAGLAVYPWYLQKPGESTDLNLSGIFWFRGKTNAMGEVTFDWIPDWEEKTITFWPLSKIFDRERYAFDPKKSPEQPVVVTLNRLVELRGEVRDAASKPVAEAIVKISGAGYSALDGFRGETKTDQDGHYRINLPPFQLYMLTAFSKDLSQASTTIDGIPIYPKKLVDDIDFTLQPATRVFGRLTLGTEAKPIEKQYMSVHQLGRDLNNLKEVDFPRDPNNHHWVQPTIVHSTKTNADGRFEFYLGPGKYNLRATKQNKIPEFEITDQKELEFNFHSERPEKGILRGMVVTGTPATPVPGAKIWGVVQGRAGTDINAVTNSEGMFEVERQLHPAVLCAYTKDRSLAGIVEIEADDQDTTIPISATASYTARVVDKEGQPLSTDRQITYGVTVHDERNNKKSPTRWCFGGTIRPDQDGHVQFKGLVVGANYAVYLHNLDGNSFHRITAIEPTEPGDYDLGELVAVSPEPYRPPTIEQRIAQAFEQPNSAVERNHNAKNSARLAQARVLVTFADLQAPLVKELYKLYFEGDIAQVVGDDFRMLSIPTSDAKREDAATLAKELGIELPRDNIPLIIVEGSDGKVLGSITGSDLITNEKEISQDALLGFLKKHIPPRPDGRKLLDDALAQAKKENKRLLVQETAVWCGPCQMLSAFLDKNRAIWEKDYLWIKMDPRWPQSTEIMKSLRGEASGGYPWIAILDADGKVLATSNKSDGDNIGFPTEPDEIEHYLQMFKTTGQRITEDDLAQLKKALMHKSN